MPHTPASRARAWEKLKKRRTDWLVTNGPCNWCGSYDQLEVDHVDPEVKVDHKVWSWAEERRAKELSKCQVLCHLCHLRKTGEYRDAMVQHGTSTMYIYKGCRCEACREFQSEKMREYHRTHLRSRKQARLA